MKITNNTPYALSCRYDVTNAEIIIDRLDLAHPTPATEATGELCPYSFLWPDEPPDAERRCRAPQIPGATRCVNADRYNERCRLLVHPTPSVPDDWGPVRELPCVRCPKCGFQFAAEHRCHDGTYRCPECGEGRCAHPTPSAEACEYTARILGSCHQREHGAENLAKIDEVRAYLRSLHGGGKEGE